MFKIDSALLLLLSVGFAAADDKVVIGEQDETIAVMENLVDACAIDFDPDADIDFFPTKYSRPIIQSYGDIDIFGEKFVPHNTTDFLEITYHKTYKIVTNKHQDPPKNYLLYQCGTQIPEDVVNANDFDLVLPIPHKGGIALTQTPQIPYVELLGLRDQVIAYIGNPRYVTSPCMSHMMGEEASIETIYTRNSTLQEANIDDFRERHPDAIIVDGPGAEIKGGQVVVASTTQERTNVATFDWIHFYAAFFNMEGEANRIATNVQDSYDCSSEVAKDIAQQQRQLPEEKEKFKKPVIFWAKYFTYENLGWSVAECPTWDSTYYCEYAEHCGATIISRPADFGYNRTFASSPTVYWYVSDEEAIKMGQDADVIIYSGDDWDKIYALKNETLDQFKAVQNKMVFDTLGQGVSTWNEQRYAEYDVVGLDMCDVVGHASKTGPKHERRWFRNVYTEPVGALASCDVEGGEISQPYVPPGQECVRPQEKLPVEPISASEDSVEAVSEDSVEVASEDSVEEDAGETSMTLDDSSAVSSSMTGLISVMLAIAYAAT